MEKTIQTLLNELQRLTNVVNNSALMRYDHICNKLLTDIENIYTNLDFMYIINTSTEINNIFNYIEGKLKYFNMLHEYTKNLN
jgi:primosomal protein N''